MRRLARAQSLRLALLLGAGFGAACNQPGGVELRPPSVRIEGFTLVSERVLAPTVTESTYRATCRAGDDPFDDAVAFVSAPDLGVQLTDATLRCGRINANGSRPSVDTIVLQRDPARPFDPNTLDWITLAWGPSTLVSQQADASGARVFRYEVEFTNGAGKVQSVAASVSSAAAAVHVTDGLVVAGAQRNASVRTKDFFEVRVDGGFALDPASLVWTLSLGTRSEFALGVTRTLDGVGQPIGDVAVEERGPAGLTLRSSEPISGITTLAEQVGAFLWRFEKDGHLPVWREGTLAAGEVLFVPSPWLEQRNDETVSLSVLNGGTLGSGDPAVVRFAGGAFDAATQGTLTALHAQSLPGLLPPGWSPLAAFWLELDHEPRTPGDADLRLDDSLAPGERAFLVRFDEDTQRWIETGVAVAGSGDAATTTIAASGAYAVVVADTGASAPPAPVAGEALPATATPFPLPDGLTAQGSVVPPVAPASLDPAPITAQAEVVVSHPGTLPSGLVLRGAIDESYDLRDGTSRTAPSYQTFFTAYQRPGDDDPHTLHARFPLRPQLAIGPDDLDEAHVTVGVLPVAAFEGGFFDASGGRVAAPGVLVSAPPNAVTTARAVELRKVDPARFADLAPAGSLLVGFELAADGLLPDVRLSLGFGPQEPDANFVVARFVQSGGRSGLEPRERFASDANGVLRSTEPASGDRLPGVTGSGTYVLVQVDGPRALVRGVARDTSGQPAEGLAVEITGEPWLTFSGVGGAWKLVAPAGTAETVVTDLRNGDRGTATATLADAASVAVVDLKTAPAGPRVLDLDPVDGAVAVRTSSPIRVTFSERVAPLVPGDLVLRDAVGNEVPTTLSMNLARTEATLLPINPLASGALHTLTLADTIADPTGLPLEGARSFRFTTQSVAARGAGAELISWEPGAQTSECDGVPGFDAADSSISCVVGGPGTADPNASVVLVNETRGSTATVLAGPDGSFKNFIEADVDDFLAATFVNANQTRIRIPLSRQLFDDGSVALFQGGGILEAESDGGPVQVQIEPGAIKDKNKFKVEPLDQAALLALLQSSPPNDGQLLDGGFRVTVEGAPPAGDADLSFPVDPAKLQLPAGVAPEDGAFAAVVAHEVDGGTAYQIVDKLRFEDGKIHSNTFPFLGMLLGGITDASDIFSMVVVPIFLGTKPATVTGRVLECPGAQCLGLDAIAALQVGHPLAGAFVTLSNVGSCAPDPEHPCPPPTGGLLGNVGEDAAVQKTALTGRLQPGMVYATSGPDGRYALVAPFLAAGYVLEATHPAHPRPVSEPVIGVFDFSISGAIEKNLIFSAPFPGAVNGPVRLNAAHEPVYPAPGEPVTLQVNAYHGSGPPTVAISLDHVESLVAGVDATSDDVTLGEENLEIPSSTRARVTMEITGTPDKAFLAVFRIRASATTTDPNLEIAPKEILHTVAFGVGPPQVPNVVLPADLHDKVGPVVVTAIPSDGAVAVAPGDPITLFFNEPIDKGVEQQTDAITIAGAGGGSASFSLDLSPDQRALTIQPGPLSPDTDYTLTASTAIQDLSGNALDQEPSQSGPQGYTLQFHTAPTVVAALPDMTSGGGTVLGRGAYSFALDRAAQPALVVFDVSDPTSPTRVKRVDLPGFPRDLVFIPQYSFALRADQPAVTHDLLAVVGGDLGSASQDADGNVFQPPQYLRVFDVDDPTNPQRIVSTVLTQRIATITKVQWHPPFLVYLESGADAQFVTQVLLQEAILGSNLTTDELNGLPLFGVREQDNNGDGDFVDAANGDFAADRLPVPNPSAEFFGKRDSCLVTETNQRIQDFDFERGFCAVTLAAGKIRTLGGSLAGDVPPQYRTVSSEGQPIARIQGSVDFDVNARPKRVDVLFNVSLEIGNSIESRNLALVSLSPDGDGVSKLAVIDVSLPASPAVLRKIPFDEALGLGLLQSVSERSDGLLALATTTSIVLLDPAKLALEVPSDPAALHPAVVGVIREAGSGAQSQDGNAAGVNVVSLGGRNQVVLSQPRLSIVSFGGDDPLVDPEALVDHPDQIEKEFDRMRTVASLAPARLRATGGAVATLDPPSRKVHYHVLLDLPGGAGDEVEIALESLNRAGRSLPNLGRNFPPVRAVAPQTSTDLEQEARANCDAEIHHFTARKLSSDKASPYYNKYLSQPFAVTYERVGASELNNLRGTPKREILWSGDFLRASIDPDEHNKPMLAPFTSRVDAQEKVIRPGSSAIVRSLSALYVMGPNPPPPGGGIEARGSLGMLNAANGEVRQQTLDLTLPSRRMPIVFQRAIGGQDLHEGVFGRGWDFSYAQRIVPLDGDVFPPGQTMQLVGRATPEDSARAESRDVVLETGAASVVLFKHAGTTAPPEIAQDPLVQEKGWLDATDFYLPQKGVFDILLRFGDGQYLRVTPDGTQFWYSDSGRLERIYHRYESNYQVLGYDDRNELIRVDDKSVSEDRFVRVGYWRFGSDPLFDADVDKETDNAFIAGKVVRLLDSVGRDVLFYYNEDGLLERREGFVLAGDNGGFPGRPITRYISADQCSGDLEGIVAGAGGGGQALIDVSLSNTNAQPAASSASGAAGPIQFTPPNQNSADATDGAITSITSGGATTQYTFDAHGNASQIKLSGPHGADAVFGPEIDDQGRQVRMVYPEGNEIQYIYDVSNPVLRARNNLLEIKHIAGTRGGGDFNETFSYDARYNQRSGAATDVDGNPVTYTLRSDGKDVESIDYDGDGVRTFLRNDDGQIEETTSPDGVKITTAYESATGFRDFETLGGHTTDYSYDGSVGGRLGLPTTITHPVGLPTSIRYDARGSTVEISRGARSEKRSYDENDNPLTIERSAGTVTVTETRHYDQVGFLLSTSYGGANPDFSITYEPDEARRTKKTTYPGGIEERTWDHQGNLVQRKLGTLVTDYVRDRNGNVVEVHEGGELVSELTRDGHDRVVEMKRHGSASGIDLFEYGYKPSGVVTSTKVTDPNDGVVAETVANDVDALGRVRAVQKSGTDNPSFSYGYAAANGLTVTEGGPFETITRHSDTAGRLDSVSDSVGTLVHQLDENGNIDLTTSTEDGTPFIADYGYDDLDHLESLADGEGTIETYTPRADGYAEQVTDGGGNVTQQSFTPLGEQTLRSAMNGVSVSFAYDGSRLLQSVQDAGGLGVTYTPDPDIPFRVKTTTRDGGGSFDVSGRDPRGNPTTVAIPGGSIGSTYDLLGRQLTQSISYTSADFATTFEYDALDRIRVATYPGGTATYKYDELGPLHSATFEEGGQTFPVVHGIRGDGARVSLDYPSGASVTEGRDPAGRITSVSGTLPFFTRVTPGGRGLIHEATLGGVIHEVREHDGRRRVRSVRYEGPGGQLLADCRYQYDGASNPEARQELHRGGRADLFSHDAGNRLASAHVDARPAGVAAEARALAAPPLGFAAGRYARNYGYDAGGLDLLTDTPADNPDGLPIPLFAASRANHDGLRHAHRVDGFDRGTPDPLGNVERTQLVVRDACTSGAPCAPVLVPATLTYDGASHLVRVERDDGVVVEYDYQHTGLFHRRRVLRGGNLESERAYVWDEDRLLEEWDVTGSQQLLARYYYRDEDAPFAAELRGASGLEPFFFLRDASQSVMVVADASGAARERVHYDPFGQPTIEAADASAPRIARIVATADGVRVEYSEPIVAPVATAAGTDLVASAQALGNAITLQAGSTPITATSSFEEAAPGFAFGTVLRVRFTHQPGAGLTLRVAAGSVTDEWNNPAGAEAIAFTDAANAGAVLADTQAAPTAPAPLRRSALGSPILFQGQWFDYETGLLFLRARFYDPYTGQFLQRDPAGYEQSPNQYAGLGNNPVAYRDPSGTSIQSTVEAILDFVRGGARGAREAVGAVGEVEAAVIAEARQLRGSVRQARRVQIARAATEADRIRIAREALAEEGRWFAEDVADRVLGNGRSFDERLGGLSRSALDASGRSSEILSDDAFRQLARAYEPEIGARARRLAREGFEAGRNPSRQLGNLRVIAVQEELVEAARTGGRFLSEEHPAGTANAFSVLVGNYAHEVGDAALEASRVANVGRVPIPDGGIAVQIWQTHFENAFIRGLAAYDHDLAVDVAPLLRGGLGALE